jgi:hypothetical protein
VQLSGYPTSYSFGNAQVIEDDAGGGLLVYGGRKLTLRNANPALSTIFSGGLGLDIRTIGNQFAFESYLNSGATTDLVTIDGQSGNILVILGQIGVGSLNSDSSVKLNLSGTNPKLVIVDPAGAIPGGISMSGSGQIVNYGDNYIGPSGNGFYLGGYFREDTRGATHASTFFSWHSVATGSGTITTTTSSTGTGTGTVTVTTSNTSTGSATATKTASSTMVGTSTSTATGYYPGLDTQIAAMSMTGDLVLTGSVDATNTTTASATSSMIVKTKSSGKIDVSLLPTGTDANSVAAGTDSRITGAAQGAMLVHMNGCTATYHTGTGTGTATDTATGVSWSLASDPTFTCTSTNTYVQANPDAAGKVPLSTGANAYSWTTLVGSGSNQCLAGNTSYLTPNTVNSTYAYPSSITFSGGQATSVTAGYTPANTSLSNLSSVAVNTDILPATDGTSLVGSTAKRWWLGYFVSLNSSYLQLGLAGIASGGLNFNGYVSGTVTLQPSSATGNYILTLPTSLGTTGQALGVTDNSGTMGWLNFLPTSAVTIGAASIGYLAVFNGNNSVTGGPSYSFASNAYSIPRSDGNGKIDGTAASGWTTHKVTMPTGVPVFNTLLTSSSTTSILASVTATSRPYAYVVVATGSVPIEVALAGSCSLGILNNGSVVNALQYAIFPSGENTWLAPTSITVMTTVPANSTPAIALQLGSVADGNHCQVYAGAANFVVQELPAN